MYPENSETPFPRRRIKKRCRNLFAATLEIIVIATLATALAQPRWFFLIGGGCNHSFLGAYQFFYVGYFETKAITTADLPSTSLIYHGSSQTLVDCVTPQIVTLFRVTIALTFFAIICCFIQFTFDVLGINRKVIKILQRNAIGSIVTVILCVCIIGTCYYMSILMEHQQKNKRIRDGAKVMIVFHISYYLVTAAGVVAVIAAAANLIKRYPTSVSSRCRHARRLMANDENSLIEDFEGRETFSIQRNNSMFNSMLAPPYPRWPGHESSQVPSQAPPPYTP